jgi:choline dehydrogenase-like flavoprotein
VYLHDRELNSLEEAFRDAVAERWPHRRAVVNHVAEYPPAPLSPMLVAARTTGNLELVPNTVAASLHHGLNGTIDGVNVVDATTGERSVLKAEFVVLGASAFETTRLLLNSSSDAHPDGVGNGHGLVGTRILEHIMASILDELPPSALRPDPHYRHDPFRLNEEPHGFYIPSYAQTEEPEFGEYGYGVQGTISTDTGLFYVGAFGETRPADRNRLRVDRSKVDRHGIPVAAIDFAWSADDIALFERANRAVVEMTAEFQRASGIGLKSPMATRVYHKLVAERPTPGSNHECGGARMGTDPATSVVDPNGRVWDAPNVVVCDTSVFPSIPQQNPTLTSMALAVRASRTLVREAGNAMTK